MVFGHDPLRNGQAESGVRAGSRRISAVEALKDARAVSGRDSSAVVANDKASPSVLGVEANLDRRAPIAKRVVQQDPQQLAHRAFATDDRGLLGVARQLSL